MGIDLAVLRFVADHRSPLLNSIARAVMWAGTAPAAFAVGALAVGTFVIWTRRWRLAAAGAVALVVSYYAAAVLKAVFTRPRPPLSLALVQLGGWSMPSSQAAMTAALGVAGFLAFDWASRPALARLRPLAGLLDAAAVGAVGACMVYLGGHWLTDVLAGWCLGAAVGLASAALARRLPLPEARPRAEAQARTRDAA
ncbi:MAG: phosphatase PAP2 family protein [Actinomycetota bacterium]